MIWTKEIPKEKGYYWVVVTDTHVPEIALVEEGRLHFTDDYEAVSAGDYHMRGNRYWSVRVKEPEDRVEDIGVHLLT